MRPMKRTLVTAVCLPRRPLWFLLMAAALCLPRAMAAEATPEAKADAYRFDQTISREVLEHYLSRAITMEGMRNGRGNLALRVAQGLTR